VPDLTIGGASDEDSPRPAGLARKTLVWCASATPHQPPSLQVLSCVEQGRPDVA